LGVAYGDQGHTMAEILEYQEAVRIRPYYPAAHHNLGVVYLQLVLQP